MPFPSAEPGLGSGVRELESLLPKGGLGAADGMHRAVPPPASDGLPHIGEEGIPYTVLCRKGLGAGFPRPAIKVPLFDFHFGDGESRRGAHQMLLPRRNDSLLLSLLVVSIDPCRR